MNSHLQFYLSLFIYALDLTIFKQYYVRYLKPHIAVTFLETFGKW